MTEKFYDWHNEPHELPEREKAEWRPSAYAVVVKDNKVLMIYGKQHRYWTLPGGGMQVTESFEEACLREVKEETGYDIKLEGDPVCTVDRLYYALDEKKYYHTLGIVFKASIMGEKAAHTDEYETEKIDWLPVSKLKEYKIAPLVEKIFKKMKML